MRPRRAFTQIELLVVVAIIGSLMPAIRPKAKPWVFSDGIRSRNLIDLPP